MKKILVFDVDRSLSCLGGETEVAKLFGTPPIPIDRGLIGVKEVLKHLTTEKRIERPHPLLPDAKIIESSVELNETAEKLGVGALALDTGSHAFRQDMRLLESVVIEGKTMQRQLEMRDWGTLERLYNGFISKWTRIRAITVINFHLIYDKDDQGKMIFGAAVKGSTRETLMEYFDCVFYTKVEGSGKDRKYMWLTKPDSRGRFAKDRLGLLDEYIPQDFKMVCEAYRQRGFPFVRIMIIGESGTGKSYALKSLIY